MKNKWINWVCSGIIILTLAGCSASSAEPTVDNAAILGTIVALNVQLTQSAATLNAMIAEQSATPEATSTPDATQTPTPTLTLTPTATVLDGLYLILDSNTNCRTGPGTSFGIVATIESGNKLKAIAKSVDGEYYYVQYYDTAQHYCWVWKQTAYQIGSANWVPVYTIAPSATPTITPTSDAGFTVTYNSLQSCSSTYSLLFTVKNTGYLTWQSIKITVVDDTEGETFTHSADVFTGYSGCSVSQTQADLTTGEPGLVSTYNDPFDYDPTDHKLTVTVSLYSEKSNSGTVLSKTFTVTP